MRGKRAKLFCVRLACFVANRQFLQSIFGDPILYFVFRLARMSSLLGLIDNIGAFKLL